MASGVNPYRAPGATVADTGSGATQEVSVFSVSGRIGRARYMAYGLVMYLAVIAVVMLGALIGGLGLILIVPAYIGAVVLGFMLTIQRAHDFNWSGWACLLLFVPLVQLIFLFVPGTDGENRWGPPTPPNTVPVLIGAWMIPLVFVVGIVAAIALPGYQDYQNRAAEKLQKK